ncbi:serine O-acetyltransferase [Leucobacter luti]|uniref:Serine acetyltransferase n=1 Tax=Leucobacter luti TaxID=340320 RepID=A0A4R6RX90_9MICO|nr:serine O-acetyltransferase [Leucobacter luti]MCW2288353.1 serine O-acetyltransferase [Leucobacter luti]QYM75703.1 serine O-acetyltransferase [Leucobacter luti]TCK45490.1 serine O-acetyltransferase [Leucobacter luti]TDP91603.1 serine O-acetyltransferase [Leucobacter luti]
MSFFSRMREDVDAARAHDPAARGRGEVFFIYSGLHAVWWHRVSHALWRRGMRFLPRAISQLTRFFTGIEIHPGATIGRRLFIDHGMGVVIGETAQVGDDVLIYHGVTLGGTGHGAGKRHPTLGDRVIVGAGAKLLGNIELGDDSAVGANAVVVHSAPPWTTLTGIPAQGRPRRGAPAEQPDMADFYMI